MDNKLRDELAKKEGAPYHETWAAREVAFKNGWDACLEQILKDDRIEFIEMADRIINNRRKQQLQNMKTYNDFRKELLEWYRTNCPNSTAPRESVISVLYDDYVKDYEAKQKV